MQKIIGVDFDDVLMDFNTALAAFHNNTYGTSYGKGDVLSDKLEDLWQCSYEECFRRVSEFYRSQQHADALPVPGAVEATKKLSREHKLFIITSRPEEVRGQTQAWLDKHFPNIFEGVRLTNLFSVGEIKKRTKAEVCKDLDTDFFIDDFIHHTIDVSSAGKKALLFNAPWNQEEIPPEITRVHSWDEIVEQIEN